MSQIESESCLSQGFNFKLGRLATGRKVCMAAKQAILGYYRCTTTLSIMTFSIMTFSIARLSIIINVEGVTLVLPSCFSCLTNIRENISYKLEYRLCETRSICTSTSITLKKKGQAFFPPLLSTKSHLMHTRNINFTSQSASVL